MACIHTFCPRHFAQHSYSICCFIIVNLNCSWWRHSLNVLWMTIIRNVACFLLLLITCMLLRTSAIKQHNLLLHRYFISKSEFLKDELTAYKDQPLPMHFKEILKPYLGLYHSTSVNHDHKIPLLKIQKMAK